jgi:hypothetical protein
VVFSTSEAVETSLRAGCLSIGCSKPGYLKLIKDRLNRVYFKASKTEAVE